MTNRIAALELAKICHTNIMHFSAARQKNCS